MNLILVEVDVKDNKQVVSVFHDGNNYVKVENRVFSQYKDLKLTCFIRPGLRSFLRRQGYDPQYDYKCALIKVKEVV